MASIWDVVTGKVARKDVSATAATEAKQAASDARLKREAEAESKRKDDIKAAAKCDITPTNPSGICFKKGGLVKSSTKGFKW
jgi:hypothetical protein